MPDRRRKSTRRRSVQANQTPESCGFAALKDVGFLTSRQVDATMAALAIDDDRSPLYVLAGPTAFGKTHVGIALLQLYLARGYYVLWISKRWLHLKNAVDKLLPVFPEYERTLRRVGGERECLRHLPTDSRGRVFFTTLQTWHKRQVGAALPERLKRSRRLLIIWDECHWAVDAYLGKRFLKHYFARRGGRNNPLMIGLSATPRDSQARQVHVFWKVPYVELVGERVAHPIVKNVQTNVIWDPIVQNHIVSPRSLDDLAANLDRNQLIVREILAGRQRGDYQKIIVFACNIKHAIVLTRMIAEGGAPVRVVHSQMSQRQCDLAVEGFRGGKFEVLVNVNQLVEGVDIPDINAVFIARPTTCVGTLLQMIGRGARLIKGKTHFWIVEFTDVIRQNSAEFFHATQFLGSSSHLPARSQTRGRGPVRHAEPNDVQLESIDIPNLGEITIAHDQTFGVEIELTSPDGVPERNTRKWREGAKIILSRLRESATAPVGPQPLAYHENDDLTRWVLEHDRSCGWEVVSPILSNAEGFDELRRVCEGLADLVRSDDRFHVNYRTGLHVTLGTRLNTDERLRGFVKRLQRIEPGLLTLVPPSRLFRFNGTCYETRSRNSYCAPVREAIRNVDVIRLVDFSRNDDRYYTVNLAHAYDEIEKLEIRLHSGTTDFSKIAAWISLWMLIFNKSRYEWTGDGVHGPIFPGGNRGISHQNVAQEDIFTLLPQEGIYLGADLARILLQRRSELRTAWAKILPQRVESWSAAGWYRDDPPFVSPQLDLVIPLSSLPGARQNDARG